MVRVKSMPKRGRESTEVLVYKKAKSGSSKLEMKKQAFAKRFGSKQESAPEVKVKDTDFNTAQTSTGDVVLLNGMAQGTSSSTRIGAKIEFSSVDIRLSYQISVAQLTTITGPPINCDSCFIALVYDRQPNTAAPAFTDVFTNAVTIGAALGHRNITNLDRFEVLYKEVLSVSTGGPQNVQCLKYIKTCHDTRYNGGTAGTVADINSGALWLMSANQNAIANVANSGLLIGEVRLNFHDM